MEAYSTLQMLGWLTVGFAMFLFGATGGFDFGAGILAPFIGKNDTERRVVINSVGPTWDGNQVWLITIGGLLFAIWPRVYAAAFSGFYFAMLLVLWTLFLRPVSFEYRHKIESERWRTFWDWALFIGSFVPSLVIGIAVGNLLLGVPFHYDEISLRFFYDGSFWGLFRGLPILTGFFCVTLMVMHGAAYLQLRTEGIVLQRAKTALVYSSILVIILFILIGFWIEFRVKGYMLVNPQGKMLLHPLVNHVELRTGAWMFNYQQHHWMLTAPALGILGALLTAMLCKHNKRLLAFSTSVLSVLGIVFTWGLAMFPFIMPSSSAPSQSLTAWNASSSAESLNGILWCAAVMLPIIFLYTGFVYRKLWGRGERMSVGRVGRETHNLY